MDRKFAGIMEESPINQDDEPVWYENDQLIQFPGPAIKFIHRGISGKKKEFIMTNTSAAGKDAFSERMIKILYYGALNLAPAIGYRTGLLDAMDPMGPFLYTVSLMHGLPVGLVDGGAGLGR